jgi:hypothetical protein
MFFIHHILEKNESIMGQVVIYFYRFQESLKLWRKMLYNVNTEFRVGPTQVPFK